MTFWLKQTTHNDYHQVSEAVPLKWPKVGCGAAKKQLKKEHLLSTRVWSGCDTKSAIFGKEKATFMRLVSKSESIQLATEIMYRYWATDVKIKKAEKIFVEM